MAAHLAEISRTIATILEHLAKKRKATRGRVHDLRRAARGGDVAVRLLSGHLASAKSLRKAFRKLRHIAGEVRDLDVALELLEPPRSKVARWLVGQARKVRLDRELDLVRFARRKPRGGVGARTERLLKRQSATPASIARALLAMEKRLKARSRLAAQDDASLHAARIEGKRVAIAWEMLAINARESQRLASTVRALGNAHDRAVTAAFIDALLDDAGDKAPAGARDIANRLRAQAISGPTRPHLL